MPKAKKKSPRAKEMPEYFIFEIDAWEPYYMFSINTDKYIEDSYSENAGLEMKTHCVFPEKLNGREATIRLASKRDGLVCAWEKNLPDMKLKGIGELELSPGYGRFYSSIPHESLGFLSSSLGDGKFRFILFYGPPLKRNRSLCVSMEFKRDVNLEEY